MTTQTHTLPQLDPALDWDVPCMKCDDPASWAQIFTCCGESGFLCVPHLEAVKVLCDSVFRTDIVWCAHCGQLMQPSDIRYEPIR